MKSISFTVQALQQVFNLTTNKQINRYTDKQTDLTKTIYSDHTIRGHKDSCIQWEINLETFDQSRPFLSENNSVYYLSLIRKSLRHHQVVLITYMFFFFFFERGNSQRATTQARCHQEDADNRQKRNEGCKKKENQCPGPTTDGEGCRCHTGNRHPGSPVCNDSLARYSGHH